MQKTKSARRLQLLPHSWFRPVKQRSSSLPATYQKIDCSHAVPYFSEDRCDWRLSSWISGRSTQWGVGDGLGGTKMAAPFPSTATNSDCRPLGTCETNYGRRPYWSWKSYEKIGTVKNLIGKPTWHFSTRVTNSWSTHLHSRNVSIFWINFSTKDICRGLTIRKIRTNNSAPCKFKTFFI